MTAPGLSVAHPSADEWAGVGGYAAVKARLAQLIAWPLKHPRKLASMGVRIFVLWTHFCLQRRVSEIYDILIGACDRRRVCMQWVWPRRW